MYRLHSKKKQSPTVTIILWIFLISLSVYFFWITINPNQKGIVGNFIYGIAFAVFGQSIYIFPFLFFYGSLRILFKIGKPHKGIISLITGILITMVSLSAILEHLHYTSIIESAKGGWIGYFTESLFKTLFGTSGGVIFMIAILVVGINIIFEIKWLNLFIKIRDIIKNDWQDWKKARAELSAKIEKAKIEKMAKKGQQISEFNVNKELQTENSQTEIKNLPDENKEKKDESQQKQYNESVEKNKNQKQFSETKKINPDFLKFKNFKLPTVDLLNKNLKDTFMPDNAEIQSAKTKLEETLKNFNISAYISGIYPGPVITRYEVTPSPGVKISSIVSLSNDIALAMKSAGAIRVIAPIPGKSAIGFEIPNIKRSTVSLREVIESPQFNSSNNKLTFALGRYSDGSIAIANLEEMPHLLVAGATGSGKSVFLQSLILSIIYKNTPDEVKFLFIDPKRLELTSYESIPYLYDPRSTPDEVHVITNPKEASKSLVALTRVMEARYKKFEKAKVKNINSYNKWALENNQPQEFYIIVVIDELADLMLQAKNVVEEAIQRLTQMARAVGIHMVLATQRPSVDVITGVIKANLPARIALQVSSKVDSRVIIDTPGAESLIGKGDLLFLAPNKSKPDRIQGCYVSEEEIEKVVRFISEQGKPDYPLYIEEEQSQFEGKGSSSEELIAALNLIMERKRVSQDLLKAHFGSSARATNILSLLEVKGFIYKPEGTNRWQIYFDKIETYLKSIQTKQKEG